MSRSLKVSFIVIGGSLVVFWIALYWVNRLSNDTVLAIISDKTILQQQSTISEVLASLKKDLTAAKAYENAIDNLVPPKDQLVFGLSNWLGSQERLYGVKANFQFQGKEVESTDDTLGRVAFLMDVTGSVESVIAFLKDLEFNSSRFLMSFDSIEFVKVDPSYKVSVTGYAFFR